MGSLPRPSRSPPLPLPVSDAHNRHTTTRGVASDGISSKFIILARRVEGLRGSEFAEGLLRLGLVWLVGWCCVVGVWGLEGFAFACREGAVGWDGMFAFVCLCVCVCVCGWGGRRREGRRREKGEVYEFPFGYDIIDTLNFL